MISASKQGALFVPAIGATLYHRTITIDHTKCGATDTSNYPMWLALSDATLKDQAHSGHVYRSDGYDITFYSDSGYTTLLSWEMRKYDNVNGKIYAYIKIPTLSHTTDTVIYMRFGSTSITTFQGGSTGSAWNSNFKSVIHGGDGTTLALSDSTSNGENGTNSSATAGAGKLMGSWHVQSGQRVTLAHGFNTIVGGSASHSLEYWVNVDTYSGGDEYVFDGDNANSIGAFLNHVSSTSIQWGYASTFRTYSSMSPTAPTGTWVHVLAEKTGAGDNGNLYINGVKQTTISGTLGNMASSTTTLNWGNYHTSSMLAMEGYIEDARLSNVARGVDYALATYNNGNSPGNIGSAGFYSVSSET